MKDKRMTLEDAAARVRDGDRIVLGGEGAPPPMAMLRRLVADGRRDLRLVAVVGAGLNVDLAVGAGAVASVDTCSVGLAPYARTAPNFARHCEAGRIRALDNT